MVTLHGEHRDFGTALAITPVSESAAAVAVIVLAVLGLVNVLPEIMVAIATIVIGAAILLQGVQTVGQYAALGSTAAGVTTTAAGAGGGLAVAALAGGAGIVLGILSLFTHAPTLTPAALIVFGATLLLNGVVAARGARRTSAPLGTAAQPGEVMAAQVGELASGAEIMIGIAGLVLGILALVPIHDIILTLVGLLVVGAGVLIAAAASGGAAFSALRR